MLTAVTATTPYNGQQSVAASAKMTVRFDSMMNAATVNAANLQLIDAAGQVLPAAVTYDAVARTATLTPENTLTATANYYTVKVAGGTAGVTDASGVPLTGGDYTFDFTTGTPTFTEQTAFANLKTPTAIRFADDGRVFVAEKRGIIKVFDSLSDTTATVVADLRTQVHNFWDRGLLGMTLDPQFTTGRPYIYVLYTFDGDIGGTAPKFGTVNGDDDAGVTDGTGTASGKLSRLTIVNNVMTAEKVLVNDWVSQYPSHSIGDLAFGPDGFLYASAGEGANYGAVDYGNFGNPFNDPTKEGGALRSQDVRTTGDPTGLAGTVIRVDADTGNGAAGNPFASSTDSNARRIVAYGLRNPYRISFRPGTSELYIADVGWNAYEELDRMNVANPAAAPNFGWPAYEGPLPQAGYQAANLPLLQSLYASGTAVMPWFSYAHAEQVVPGSGEPTGGSAPAGIAFNDGSAYGDAYRGAMFFADYARKQIYVMYRGPDGSPDPSTRQLFKAVSDIHGIVGLQTGPDGNLYYVDLYQSTIQRFVYKQPTPPPVVVTVGQLTGTVIGTAGSYADNGYTRDNAFDGNFFTFFDAPVADGAWAGLDFGAAKVVRKIGFAPRYDWPERLVGGRFQVSNDPTFATGVATLYTVNSTPLPGVMTNVNVNNSTAYRYARFLGADGSAANIAEVAFFDTADTDTGTGTGLKGTYFDNQDLTGTTATRVDPVVNFFWNADVSPISGISPLTYSTRWTGQVQAIEAGAYAIRVTGDDGVRLWIDGQLVIDKWIDQAPTAYAVPVTFTAGEKKDIRLEYYQAGYGASVKLEWQRPSKTAYETVPTAQLYPTGGASSGTPPVPVINTPTGLDNWKVGDVVTFSGGATDAEDGALPASSLTWSVVLIHGNPINPANTHEHTIQTISDATSGSFVAPDHEFPSWLELRLKAVDSTGQATTVSRRLDPMISQITLTSNVGVSLTFNDSTVAAPSTQTYIVGADALIAAPDQVVVGGQIMKFVGWSDGGAASHIIKAGAANTTYVATYAAVFPAPTGLTTTATSSTQVAVKWTDAATTETGYAIERRVAGADAWTALATLAANAVAYTDTAVVGGTAYEYRVRAINATEQSAYATTAAVITPLQTPTLLAASNITTNSVTLKWADNATTETDYTIERRLAGSGDSGWVAVGSVAANVVTFGDATASPGTAYEYRVRAINATTKSAYSTSVAVTTLLPAPAAPSALAASAVTTTGVTLTWADNSTNETGFRVERRVAGGTFAVVSTLGTNVKTFTDTGLSSATAYEYRVSAFNGGVASTPTSALAVTTATPQAAPTNLRANVASNRRVTLTWVDRATAETGYRVERRTAGGAWAVIGSPAVNATTYTDTTSVTNTSYEYRVYAIAATGPGLYSAVLPVNTATTGAVAPAAPTTLTATGLSTSSMLLNWIDTAANEDGYKIERRYFGVWYQIGTVSANATSYTVTGLSRATSYEFRVRGYYGSTNSAYSNTVTGRTL